MSEPARHLRVIHGHLADDEGTVLGLAEAIPFIELGLTQIEQLEAELDDTQKMLRRAENRIRGLDLRIANLESDWHRFRVEHPLRPHIVSIAKEWSHVCRHPKAVLTDERFDLVLALIGRTPINPEFGRHYTRANFSRAIAGAAYDCFETTRRNGKTKRHDGLELICRDGARFEEFNCRAPKGWEPPPGLVEFPEKRTWKTTPWAS